MSLSFSCTNCASKEIYSDDVSGEYVCTECGVVLEKQLTHVPFSMESDSSVECVLQRDIQTICKRYKLGKNTYRAAIEYCALTSTTRADLPYITVCIFFIETDASVSNIHMVCKKRRFETEKVFAKLEEIRKQFNLPIKHVYTHTATSVQCTSGDDWTTNHHSEWVEVLVADIVTKASRSVEHRKLAQIKQFTYNLIHNKPECLFHNTNVMSTVILLKHHVEVEHQLPASKIRNIMKKFFV